MSVDVTGKGRHHPHRPDPNRFAPPESDTPPLAVGPRHNLPPQPTPFVGRDAEREVMDEAQLERKRAEQARREAAGGRPRDRGSGLDRSRGDGGDAPGDGTGWEPAPPARAPTLGFVGGAATRLDSAEADE